MREDESATEQKQQQVRGLGVSVRAKVRACVYDGASMA